MDLSEFFKVYNRFNNRNKIKTINKLK